MPLSGLSAMSSTFHQKQLFAGSSLGISRSSKKKKGDKAAYHDLLDPSKVEALYNGHSLFFVTTCCEKNDDTEICN